MLVLSTEKMNSHAYQLNSQANGLPFKKSEQALVLLSSH